MLWRDLLKLGSLSLLLPCVALGQPPVPGSIAQPGQVMTPGAQEILRLTPEQKKQIEDLQKEVDAKLAKILTSEQTKSLRDMRRNPFDGFGGFGGGPGGFGGGPGGGGFGGGPGGFGGGPGGFGGGPGGFGGFGGIPGVRIDEVKKQINATEEEWKVIGPKLQKVIAARQILTFDPQQTTAWNAIAQARTDLKNELDDPNHTKAAVDEKITALKKARQKAREELEAAYKSLSLLITPTQEAILLSLGYLE